MLTNRVAGVVLVLTVSGVPAALAQSTLVGLLGRHGVDVKEGRVGEAFDAHAEPTMPLNPGSFAAPLAALAAGEGPSGLPPPMRSAFSRAGRAAPHPRRS